MCSSIFICGSSLKPNQFKAILGATLVPKLRLVPVVGAVGHPHKGFAIRPAVAILFFC